MSHHTNLLDRINESDVVNICRALVRYKTINPPGDELVAAQYVAGLLGQAGFETALVPIAETRASIVARLRGAGAAPALVLNGHLDVVPPGADPWMRDPFAADVAEGKIWGRGTADMKGGLASLLTAARLIAEANLPLQGDLIVVATADEEAGMSGAEAVIQQTDLGPLQAIIIAEPTNNQVGLAERGVLWLQLETFGKTAHGSTPHLGQNAILMMMALLAEFEKLSIPYIPHPILGNFTHSINAITGGVKANVVPDHCLATIDMRTLPSQDHRAIIRQVTQLVADLEKRITPFRGAVKLVKEHPAVETSSDAPAVCRFEQAYAQATGQPPIHATVRFATEAAVFVPALRVPAIICGPGDPAMAHRPNEFVEIRQLVEAAKIFTLAAVNMLA